MGERDEQIRIQTENEGAKNLSKQDVSGKQNMYRQKNKLYCQKS